MANKRTSKKPRAFSIDDLKPAKLKAGVEVTAHDPRKNLADREFIAKALLDCMLDGDMVAFKKILRAHYDAVNITKALKASGLSKRTFYGALEPGGNPSLETVMKMVSGLKAG